MALGLVILVLAGDILVKGAVNLSLRMGIPAMIVGLTVVAFGTSAPELLVSVNAVLDDVPGIALGNVVGSNTANILLVLGIPAVISGIRSSESDTRHSYLIMLGVSVLFIGMCYFSPISIVDGLILLFLLALMLVDQVRRALDHRNGATLAQEGAEDLEGADPGMPMWKILLFLVLGLAALPLGADMLVTSGSRIARAFGVSETVIGLTLIAVGTSLPELATSVMAALRKNADVAMGNVIGSNIFNLLGIIGVTSLIGPITVDPEFLRLDLWVMLGSAVLLAPFVYMGWNLTRGAGAVLIGLYATYLAVLLL